MCGHANFYQSAGNAAFGQRQTGYRPLDRNGKQKRLTDASFFINSPEIRALNEFFLVITAKWCYINRLDKS